MVVKSYLRRHTKLKQSSVKIATKTKSSHNEKGFDDKDLVKTEINGLSPILHKTTSQIAREIVDAYNYSKGIFANKVNAEDLLPKTSKENQIQFLFWVIQMDYSTKSSALYENTNKFWNENPKWITTKYIDSLAPDELLTIIKNKLHPRYSNEIAVRFKINALQLDKEYDSLAINIVKKSTSAIDLYNRIRSFRGFGPKLGSFLTRTYIDVLKLDYADIANVLPPVDIHDVRLSFEWGLVSDKDMTQKRIESVQHLWSDACKQAGVSWITFDKALWLIGSEGQRSDNPVMDYEYNLGFSE